MSNSALIEDLERQFSENPRRVFARLANEYRKSGNLEGAIALCREHVPRHPGYISGHIVLGQALFESGAVDDAKLAFEAALQLDPENLIALRHLGDIARQTGDIPSAIMCYHRLLEVDPQNEDAAAQLRLIEGGGTQLSGDGPLTGSTVTDHSPLVLAPLVEGADEALHAEAAISWGDINPEAITTAGGELAAVSDALSDIAGDDAPPGAAAESEHAGLLSFGEGDFELAELDASPPPAEVDAEADEPRQDEGDEFEFTVPEATAEASVPAAPSEGSATADEAFVPGEIVPERDPFDDPAELAAPVDFDMPSEDVVTLEEHESDARSVGADAFAWPPEEMPRDAYPAAEAQAEPYSSIEKPAASAEYDLPDAEGEPALVTETVAELYERQGHLAQSLEVYRQLAAQNPDNEALRLHVSRLEAELHATSRRRAATGPSMRSVFQRVLGRRPPAAPAVERGLFSGAHPSPADDRAASALAGAFAPEYAGLPAEQGRPARTAKDELSLDAIFGKSSPQSAEKNGEVSFDEFFPKTQGSAQESEQGEPRSGGGDDDEIFHSWLDGLKR